MSVLNRLASHRQLPRNESVSKTKHRHHDGARAPRLGAAINRNQEAYLPAIVDNSRTW